MAHGPHPRDYSYSMPKKALKQALRVALSGKLRDDEVLRWEGAKLDKPSTKGVRQVLESLDAGQSVLILAPEAVDKNIILSVRNLPYVVARSATDVTAYEVVRYEKLVLLDGAFEALDAQLGRGDAP